MEKLRMAQLEMFNILSEIDRICSKYEIRYWLFAGTLLGAVRHKGFIPWDDDCDIGMMREDYERLIAILPRELPSHLFLQNKETDPNYPRKIIKIRSNRIKLVEKDESFDELYNQGVFVDIFIHDYYPSWSIPVMKYFQRFIDNKKQKDKYPKGSIQRHIHHIRLLPANVFYLLSRSIFREFWKVFRYKPSDYVGVSLDYSDYKAIFRSALILPVSKKARFEDGAFSIPNNPDALLEQCYGNYRRWPAEYERHWHAKAIIIKAK